VYLPLAVYWITLFILTTIPVDSIPRLFEYQDKIEHFVAYGVLAFLLTLALFFQKRSNLLSSKAFIFAFLFILAYGAVDELHQMIVPGRYCDLYDWFANSLGGSLGIGLVYLFLSSRKVEDPEAINI
jgi:VanZ family protein